MEFKYSTISDEYIKCDEIYHTSYNRPAINGKIIGCSKCVGYCKYNGHPGFLTQELRAEHNCCQKGCNYYIPKPRREKESSKSTNHSEEILNAAIAATVDYEGFQIIRVSNHNERKCELMYVTISNSYPIRLIENMLSDIIGLSVSLRKINCDYEIAARLIFS